MSIDDAAAEIAESAEESHEIEEEWKATVGIYGYEVSNCGRIRDSATKEVLHPSGEYNGTFFIDLHKLPTASGKGQRKYIHRLVAEAWLPQTRFVSKFYKVEHINGCKHDNRACNLKWHEPTSKYSKTVRKELEGLEAARGKTPGAQRTCANCSKFHAMGSRGEGLCYDRIWVWHTEHWATCNVWTPTIPTMRR